MSLSDDEYSEIEVTEELARVLDAPLDHALATPSLDNLNFGSKEYCDVYRTILRQKTWENTEPKIVPYPWQLDVALAIHLGRDVFLIAGTGFGKTLPFVMNCWVNKTLIVWIISPLNALANQQVRTFTKWNIRAVAVNSTTTYSGIYKDILAGKYQVVISSIEAFTDTTRLLPIIQSEELARQRKHVAIMDEAHCIVKWGKLFRPRYAVAGDMRLVLPGHTPYVAATATANQATREGIKHVLRLSDDLLPVHLGNHRENLAYSVHRLKKGKSSISELLGYYPDKTRRLPRFSLIFVDNRPLGQLALSLLRQDMLPQLRYKAQIYHAFRSDNVKEILAAGFETEDGFSDLVCTESLTM
ncbi:hypothetical protein FRC12_024139, partial [Ceratobasidium sp. 428]